MKKLCLLTLYVSITLFTAGQQNQKVFDLHGPYFGQVIPGTVPEVFASGIISIPDSKYCTISFSGNMDEFYLYRWNGTKAEILNSKLVNGEWTSMKEAEFTKGYKAIEPHITFAGDKVYFNCEKPAPNSNPDNPFNIWYSVKTSSGWTDPLYAGTGMFVSSDKDANIYTTDMTAVMTTGKTYLAKVTTENGRFTSYERLDIAEFYGSQAHPCIAPDGSYIIFDIDSGHHLFVSFKNSDQTWGTAIDLTKHGFDLMAGGACVSPDGRYLFFNLNGQLMWVSTIIIEKLRPFIKNKI
jgi:hypothetical protein